jgi:group I intron endonuclease
MHVYKITNSVNDKIYVGQHGGDDLQAYFEMNLRLAFRPSAEHYKPALYRAIKKYGAEAFTIESLVRPVDREQMDALETYFIRVLETQNPKIGYNISPGGGMGGLFTPEHRKAISEAQRGKKKGIRSPEHSQKIRENKKKEWARKKELGIKPTTNGKKTSESMKQYFATIPDEKRATIGEKAKSWWASDEGLLERQKRSKAMKGNSCLILSSKKE